MKKIEIVKHILAVMQKRAGGFLQTQESFIGIFCPFHKRTFDQHNFLANHI